MAGIDRLHECGYLKNKAGISILDIGIRQSVKFGLNRIILRRNIYLFGVNYVTGMNCIISGVKRVVFGVKSIATGINHLMFGAKSCHGLTQLYWSESVSSLTHLNAVSTTENGL